VLDGGSGQFAVDGQIGGGVLKIELAPRSNHEMERGRNGGVLLDRQTTPDDQFADGRTISGHSCIERMVDTRVRDMHRELAIV